MIKNEVLKKRDLNTIKNNALKLSKELKKKISQGVIKIDLKF
jgi:hypothetical protein